MTKYLAKAKRNSNETKQDGQVATMRQPCDKWGEIGFLIPKQVFLIPKQVFLIPKQVFLIPKQVFLGRKLV